MDEKLKGYKNEQISDEEAIERLETKEPELVPDGETVVPTGDEDIPMSAADPKEARKALYDKARKNREALISRESEEHVDVAKIQAMNAEVAGGEAPKEAIDTNRPNRNDDPEYEERVAAAKAMAEGIEATKEEKHEEEIVNEEVDEAPHSLPPPAPDAKVNVKVLGKQYAVPQQDIDDAGGLEAYQKTRAATIRLQRAATLENRMLQQQQELAQQHEEQPEEDPSTDDLGEADVDSLREELLDTVLDGTKEDINKWIEEQLASRAAKTPSPPPKPDPSPPTVSTVAPSETQQELQRQFEDDRQEANAMMKQEYRDIMHDPELMGLAQQRFRVLFTDPNNEGRTQKELARESAEYVRSLGRRLVTDVPPNPTEQKRQARITRKRKLPQPSRADAPRAPKPTEDKHIPSAKEHFLRLRKASGQA